MLIDRPDIVEGSYIKNITVPVGAPFPLQSNIGEMFYLSGAPGAGFFIHDNTTWIQMYNEGGEQPAIHMADSTKHVTLNQSNLLYGLNLPTLTAAEVNRLIGVTSPIQTQINSLNSHVADGSVHLTAAQNTLLDGLAPSLTFTELNYVDGVTSPIQTQLTTLGSTKISRDGSIAMSGNLALGGNRITGVADPIAGTDVATKDYVDTIAQGLHWVGSVKAATTANIVLSGLQTIDTRPLAVSDRVLVKNQTTQSENGIYLVATGAWSRAPDANVAAELNDSAVFVLEYAGATQSKTTWVQTLVITALGTSPISYTAFSGPVVNNAGPGISLSIGGTVAVKDGAGTAFDGNNALIVDLQASGGLMITTDNISPATITNTAARLALTQSGVTAGTYNNSATTVAPFTVDSKGRITGTPAPVTITPSFASITSKPTTLAGYGITDAPTKAGVGATGTWGIDISGTAALATSVANGIPGGVLYNSALNFTSSVTPGTPGQILTSNGAGAPYWSTLSTSNAPITLSGDATGTGTSSITVTLANTAVGAGPYGSATTVPTFTVDSKGRLTAAANATIAIPASAVTSGTFADARVAATNITQHQSALTIAETQISDGTLLARNASNEVITGNWTFNTPLIGATPVSPAHLTTKAYVDTVAQGLATKPSAFAATTGNLTGTYNNGSSGVGATLSGSGALPVIDGVTLAVGNGILVKNQTAALQNGRYVVTTVTPNWVLTRCGLCDEASEIPGAFVFVNGGTQAGTGWVQTVANAGTFVIGTDPITVTQFSSAGAFIGGTGLVLTGNTFNVIGTAGRITALADSIDLTTVGTAGTYTSVTTDAYGRVTAGTNPTTLAGYGITNAVAKTGDMMSGSLAFQNGTLILASTPVSNAGAYISTAAYGIGQGDNQTHFGYNNAGVYKNFIRGVSTTISGNLIVGGTTVVDHITVTGATGGQVRINQGSVTNTGYVEFWRADQVTREGYVGFSTAGGPMRYVSDTANAHNFIGSITASGTITELSDKRLKKNITPIFNPLGKIKELHGVTFTRVDTDKDGTGLIAQDVQAILPEAIQECEDGMLSVAYGNLAGLFVEAIKELTDRIQKLQDEIEALKNK